MNNHFNGKPSFSFIKFFALILIFTLQTGSIAFASTASYTPSNLSLDSAASVYGGSNLRTASGNLYLNWNRPAVDGNHVGYWNFNDGSGTTTADASSQNNTGSFTNGGPGWSSAASAVAPYAGNHMVGFDTNQKVVVGSILNYEKTQPWTVMSAIKMSSKPAGAAIVFSNVNAGPYPGYELWVNPSGHLHVRIINNINTQFIGVEGTTDVTNNQWHFVSASYDGSSTAAGVKIYVDGVLESMTVESDTLTSGSSVSTGPFVIGNQTLYENVYYMRGYIDEFSLSNIVRSPSYIASYSTPSSLPPVDVNTVLNYHFDEDTGLSVTDSSATNQTATLSTLSIWPHKGQTWMGDSALFYDGNDKYVSMPTISAYNLGSQFTLSSWADSLTTPGAGALFYKLDSSPLGYAWHLGWTNKMQWWDAVAFRNSTVAVSTGWHKYDLRFNSGTLDFLVDGTIVKTLTGVSTPTISSVNPLVIGSWPGLAGGYWNGYISNTTMSNTNRSDGYLSTFAKRFPVSGVASLSSVSTSVSSGGGDLGVDSSITQLAATFTKPTTTNLQYRIGSGSSASAATTDKQAQSYTTLSSTNSISKTGRYVDYDIKLLSSTDTLAQDTPYLSDVTLTYAPTDTTSPTASITYSDSDGVVRTGDSLTITATLSEPIADSPVMKIAISGANTLSATNMTKVDSTHYTYVHTVGAGDGVATVSLSVGTDLSNNVITSAPTSGASFTINNTVPHNNGGGFLLYLQNQNNSPQNNTPLVINNQIPTTNSGQSLVNITRNLKYQAKGADVKTLQQFLTSQDKGPKAKALAKYGADIYFGKLTKAALIEWQELNNLVPDGILGPKTRAKILSL